MSNAWRKRKERIRSEHDRDELTIVPELLSGTDGKGYIEKRLSGEFDRTADENILIIDPYIDIRSIQKVVKLFAGQRGRSVSYLTKYESPGDVKKEEMRRIVGEVVKDIESKKLFSRFEVLEMDVPFHDRYLLSINDGKVDKCLMVGTSFNMLFRKNSALVRIENSYFKRQIFKLVEGFLSHHD